MDYKKYYIQIRDYLQAYSAKQFILLTPPPLRPETNTAENAQRAMNLVHFLKSEEFLFQTTNISVFDFFGLLADQNGFLKKEYRRVLFLDSHPNKKANKTIAPIFADYIVKIVKTYPT